MYGLEAIGSFTLQKLASSHRFPRSVTSLLAGCSGRMTCVGGVVSDAAAGEEISASSKSVRRLDGRTGMVNLRSALMPSKIRTRHTESAIWPDRLRPGRANCELGAGFMAAA